MNSTPARFRTGFAPRVAVALLAFAWLGAAAQTCDEPAGAPGEAAASPDCASAEPASLPPDGPARGAGNPVDVTTGRKIERRVDLLLADTGRWPSPAPDVARAFALTRRLPFVFSRHYLSSRHADAGLGPGWRHGFDTRLAFRSQPSPRVRIVQPDGRSLEFAPDDAGRFATGRLVDGVVVRRDGRWRWLWPGGRTLEFDARGRLARISDGDGQWLALGYRGGRLFEVLDRSGRRLRLRYARGHLVALEAPAGLRVHYAYDGAGRLVGVRGPDGRRERYWYEQAGQPAALTGAGPSVRLRSRFEYDDAGRVLTARALGRGAQATLHFHYRMADAGHSGVTRVAGPRGEAVYRWETVGAARQLVLAQGVGCDRCPPTGNRYQYDRDGRLLADGRLLLRRDGAGRVVAIEAADAPAGGEPLETREYRPGTPLDPARLVPVALGQPSVAAGRRRHATVTLDRTGRVVATHETGFAPDGRPVSRRFSLRWHRTGRLAGRLDALERLDPQDPRKVLATTRFRYDARGWLVGVLFQGGLSRTVRRDAAGRIVADSLRSAAAGIRAARGRPQASPLLPSTLVLARHGERARIDALGRITREFTDDLGRLVRIDDPRTGLREFRHDRLDRLASIRESGGRTQRFEYDAAGRLARRVQRIGTRAAVSRFVWQGSNLLRLDGPAQSSRARYDPGGRLVELEHRLLGARWVQRFEYDAAGRLVGRRLPDGSRLRFKYDGRGRPLAMYWTPAQAGAERALLDSARYERGRLASFRLGNGLVQHRAFDARGRLASIRWSGNAAGAVRWPFWHYGYDDRGRLASIDDGALRERFARDRRGRLIVRQYQRAGGPARLEYFAYDAAGEMRARRDEDGRTLRIAQAGAAATAGRPPRHLGLRLDYGPQGRIESVFAGARALARYRYNALGERVVRKTAAGVRGYLYHRRRLMAETDGAGGLRRLYLYWQGRPVCFIDYRRGRAPAIRYLVGDHLGTPVAVADEDARVLWRGRLSAFGRVVAVEGALRQPLRLPGQVADPETGLSDNYQRSYDPSAGRFLEPDPLGIAGGDSPYAYAAGDPIQSADPLGLVLFAFDGTGNTPESQTNVWLMAQQFDDYDAFDRATQVNGASFYVPGVGTTGGISDNGLVGGIAAWDLSERVAAQLERLDRYVKARYRWYLDAGATIGPGAPLGFDLDIVGFSRGAAAARDFANRVLRRRDRGYYRTLVGGGCVSLNVRFMGLFDTVLSTHVGSFELGIPEAVGYAASAIAANEHRRAFPLESILSSADARGFSGNRIEVSLAGAHADIGGGYACAGPDCDGGDLSDIALQWMRAQAEAQGVAFAPLPEAQRRVDAPILHDETRSYLFYDADPQADREVRYHAATHTDPSLAGPTAPAAGPEPSRASITEGMTDAAARAMLRPGVAADSVHVGEIDLQAYGRWLRETLGLEIDGGAGGAGVPAEQARQWP